MMNMDQQPACQHALGSAWVQARDGYLTVSTGKVKRQWKWTGKGLVTCYLKDLRSGREYADLADVKTIPCDWAHSELLPQEAEAVWRSVEAHADDDEKFTTEHLRITAEIEYPTVGVQVKLVIWAYPEAEGIRTQLWAQGTPRSKADQGSDGPQIARINGKLTQAPAPAAAMTTARVGEPAWRSLSLTGERHLKLRITGLQQSRSYTLGLAHRAASGQNVWLQSIDGETVVSAGCAEPEQSILYDVPESVRLDGTLIVRIEGAPGAEAVLNDLWLYEHGAAVEKAVADQGYEDRAARLRSLAPGNSLLAAYYAPGQPEPAEGGGEGQRLDYLPLSAQGRQLSAAGYYNDTQNRNKPQTPVLREEAVDEGCVDWASILCIDDGEGGLAWIKESHKCVNQTGVDTGIFRTGPNGMENTGWGLSAAELEPGIYKWTWASWVVLYEGGPHERELAVKRFDRLRFPVQEARDMWTLVCTWGHSLNGRDGRNYATEPEVLQEMEHVAEIGVDMLLIDDGWQVSREAGGWKPDGGIGWKPHPEAYPEGWKHVIEKKNRLNLRLGLWGVAQHTPADDLVWNWRQLGMDQVKLDFAHLRSQTELDVLMRSIRRFMLETEQRCIISWDTTEIAPRYGYFWAREYGNVHFMNRKPQIPSSVVYVPWLALRDFWQLSRYQNLNKWQLTIQNPEVTAHEHSDAWRYSAAYCAATALMGIPEFMSLPRHYSTAAKKELRTLLDTYKTHRTHIFGSEVVPVGDEPTNGSWTGFQSLHGDKDFGYLTVFREIDNSEEHQDIRLNGLDAARKLRITDLVSGGEWTADVNSDGRVRFELAKPGEYMFLRYEIPYS